MTNLYTLIPALLIIGTCLFSYLGFTNRVIFDRYQFQVGQVRYNKQLPPDYIGLFACRLGAFVF